jgi:hypothetical protein
MTVSDGILAFQVAIVKSLLARKINQSDVINWVHLTRLYSTSLLLYILILPADGLVMYLLFAVEIVNSCL